MSIRFKFRSSVNFDTIEIDGGKPYISLGNLRSKILFQKKLNISHKDFDLVFSDALTGQEYTDDKFKIPSGSSVIIKRVPAEPVPSAMIKHQKLEASELSEDIPKGMNHNKPVEIVLEKKRKQELDVDIKLEKVGSANCLDLQSSGLPSDLKCPLCKTYFKEAVMIPCCQHSFCKNCIDEVLVATARCPRCSSTKFRVEHLLPNLSLRRAIEHFLESQIVDNAPENDLQKYVPDGESGIQGKEVSCAVPITKKKKDLLTSISETGKGSNQNMAESVYESPNVKSTFMKGAGYHIGNSNAQDLTPLFGVKHNNGDKGTPEDFAPVADSQGENQPLNMLQARMPDEGGRSFAVGNRNKKVDRTCYKCGSPDHLIRDCPLASTPHFMPRTGNPMFQGGIPGYPMPYWGSALYPPVSPYMNIYGGPGMMPYNAALAPVSPYGVPHYGPSMYGSLNVPNGIMRMGGLAPTVGTRAERPLTHMENLELHNYDNRRNASDEKREHPFVYEDDGCQKRQRHHNDELERSSDYKSHRDRVKTLSNSEESHGRKLRHDRDKHLDQNIRAVDERYEKRSHSGRDRRSYHTDRSISGIDDVHNSNDREDEAKYKQHYRSSRRHHESKEQSGSDSSRSRHQSKRERGHKRFSDSNAEDFQHKHNNHFSSSSGDHKKRKRVQ